MAAGDHETGEPRARGKLFVSSLPVPKRVRRMWRCAIPTVTQVRDKLNCEISKGRGGWHMPEPKIMEQEAERKIRNDTGSRRFTIITDADGKSRLEAIWEAWARELGGNPTLRLEAFEAALSGFDLKDRKSVV